MQRISVEAFKVIELVLYPLTQTLLLCVIAVLALLLGRTRAACWSMGLATVWLYLSSTAFVADYLMGSLEDPFPSRAVSSVPRADTIVLLGGAIRGETLHGRMGDLNQQADRLVQAVALYRAGKAPLLLLSGGAPPGARSEAEIMRELLEVMGVPESAMVLEQRSRDTYENAVFSAAALQRMGVRRILLVTSAFHMRRAAAVFRAQGLDVIPVGTDYQRLAGPATLPRWLPSVGDLWQTTYALHEIFGYWVYRWQGRI